MIKNIDDLLFGYLVAASNRVIDLTNLTTSIEIMNNNEKELVLNNLHDFFIRNSS